MKKTLALLMVVAGSLFVSQKTQAQSYGYANEALMFSRYQTIGSARTTAIGGAQIALGADLGGIFLNPAGAGVFNKNEIQFTPALKVSGNDATYLGTSSFNDKVNAYIPSAGLVWGQRKKDKTTGWLGGSFALTYSQLANFNDRFSYEGTNAEHGLISRIIDIYDAGADDLLTDLAYETFLVGNYYYFDEDGTRIDFYSPAFEPSEQFPVVQRESVTKKGNISAISAAYGGNFGDKLYIGAGLNLTSVSLNTTKNFTEIFQSNDDVPRYRVEEIQDLTGGGVNLTIGVIGRPLPFLRLGLSYQTPTYYDLTEDYTTRLDVTYNNFPVNQDGIFLEGYDDEVVLSNADTENLNTYDFQLRTPSRLNVGAAVFIGKAGFITTDVEYVNYAGSKLTDEDNFLRPDNEAIERDYKSGINVRTGGEYRYDILRLRAGYAYSTDPYTNANGRDLDLHTITAGAGLHFKNYYFDLALAHRTGENYYIPYGYGSQTNYVDIENKVTTALLTVGVTF